MSETRTRRWPMRLAKSSPLIAVGLLLLLALSLPLPLPYALISLAYPPLLFMGDGTAEPGMDNAYLEMRAAEEASIADYTSGLEPNPSMFVSAAEEVWRQVSMDSEDLLSGDTYRAVPFPYDDEVYTPIARWEDANEATVWAWMVTAPEMPPIIASARGRNGVSITPQPIYGPPTLNGEADVSEPDVVDDGKDAIAPWLWREVHTKEAAVPALDASMFTRGTGGGMGGGSDVRTGSTIVVDGMAWRAITVFTMEDPDDPVAWPVVPAELLSADPRGAGYDAWLKELADEHDMDVWVFGPLESDAIPLRVPAGNDESDARDLGAQAWPSWYLQTTGMAQLPRIDELADPMAQLAGGRFGVMYATSWMNQSSSYYVPTGEVAAPTIVFLIVWDESPVAPPGVLRAAWYGWQGFVGRNTRPIMGTAYLFALVSLVLSPSAFVVDRKRRVRARAAEERERMHRDAHDKVYNRLSALSKRVAEVGDTAVNGTAGSLGAIAEDIRSTVGELQEILGDDVEHTASALATVPLADQLAAVCKAQAARLGVEVACDVPSGLDTLSPDLGWDLQCITEEAITNAVRHGGAGVVTVNVTSHSGGGLTLTVTDDGSGSAITDASSAPEGSTGLKGIQRRVDRHAGTLGLRSSDAGTTLTVTVPGR